MLGQYYSADHKIAIVYRGASAPTVSGQLSISGTASNGKRLVASQLAFASISGVAQVNYQWYSCSSPVASGVTSKPASCKLISKATASSFKVTTQQKNKYVTVAVEAKNAIGTTVLFAPVTRKAK